MSGAVWFLLLGVIAVTLGAGGLAYWGYFALVPDFAMRDFIGGVVVTVVATIALFVSAMYASDF